MVKKKDETAEDDAADTETSTDEAGGIVCGRCGKPFTDDQLEKGVECTHWRCPIN